MSVYFSAIIEELNKSDPSDEQGRKIKGKIHGLKYL